MDLITKHANHKTFCDRIQSSSYEQGLQNNNIPAYPSIIELFFSNFDHHFSMIESKDKDLYVKQLIVKIAGDIDEKADSNYNNFSYLKCMNPTLIQQGLQSMKSVSALLYLSDIYNVSTNVYIEKQVVKITTSDKIRKEFNIMYTSDGKWRELETIPDNFKEGIFEDLGNGLTLDVSTKDIYKKFLNPIGKYKAAELIDIAKGMNISLEKNGKKKVKKELYDDINLYQFNLK